MPKLIHGDGSTKPSKRRAEYRVWANMHNRCSSPRAQQWARYGARGISVCREWGDYRQFLIDMGRRPSPQHSLERIDVDGNYEPGNCRWATAKDQARNRRTSRVLVHEAESLTVAEWAERRGIPWSTLNNRLLRGWSVAKALDTPIGAVSCWDTRKRRAS